VAGGDGSNNESRGLGLSNSFFSLFFLLSWQSKKIILYFFFTFGRCTMVVHRVIHVSPLTKLRVYKILQIHEGNRTRLEFYS